MNLSDIFSAVAHKELVLVDLPDAGSHQHELNGTAALRELFGTADQTRGKISWHYFADDQEPLQEDGDFTFYDARAKTADKTGRSEWRFYYPGSFLSRASVGDLLILAQSRSGYYFGLVFRRASSWHRAAVEFFGLTDLRTSFAVVPKDKLISYKFELLRNQILNELDLGLVLPVSRTDEELIVQKFGCKFPTTLEMSVFARSQVDIDYKQTDEALVRWLEREEQLFRAMEKVIIGERIANGFSTVNSFIEYSLSVQNRRKSRMGFALQNHMAELFAKHGLRFTAQARTEGNNRPDFIFPGEREYGDPSFDSMLLVMLGVKSTSKDRWRQVLAEADRIPDKHLCTLETGISTKQTDEMQRQRLTLVVPAKLHATYTIEQRRKLLSVEDFVRFVQRKQS